MLACLQIEEMVEVPVVLELASDLLDRRCPIFRWVVGQVTGSWQSQHARVAQNTRLWLFQSSQSLVCCCRYQHTKLVQQVAISSCSRDDTCVFVLAVIAWSPSNDCERRFGLTAKAPVTHPP